MPTHFHAIVWIVAYAKRHFKIAPARVAATGGSFNR
jgi:hypothetical protein